MLGAQTVDVKAEVQKLRVRAGVKPFGLYSLTFVLH